MSANGGTSGQSRGVPQDEPLPPQTRPRIDPGRARRLLKLLIMRLSAALLVRLGMGSCQARLKVVVGRPRVPDR